MRDAQDGRGRCPRWQLIGLRGVAAILAGGALLLPPRSDAEPLVLTAEQSTGGVLKATSKGDLIGVVLNPSCATNYPGGREASIGWALPAPLPSGWWHVKAESSWKGYANRDLGLMLVATGDPQVSVSDIYWSRDEAQRQDPIEGWIYSSSPVTAVRIKPASDIWRWNETWPVRRITLEAMAPGALTPADAVTVVATVASNAALTLPLALPAGNYRLGALLAKRGKDPGYVVSTGADGRTIESAFPFDRYGRGPGAIYTYLPCALTSLAIRADYRYGAVVVQHRPTRMTALRPLAPEAGGLAVTVDPSRTETASLELIGSGLTGAPPAFAVYPQGKTIAVLTTWDDGKPEDKRCAEILRKQGYHPTFFMNANSPALAFLGDLEAQGVEIGSHCFNHPSLYTIPPAAAAEECVAMRKVLEQKLGHPVISFAYPNGYSPARDPEGDYVLRAVATAGYWSGRTTITAQETLASSTNLLAMRTDGFFGNAKDLERVWQTTRTNAGSVFYFWGHSWQIGKTDEYWRKFDDFVAQFARQPNAWYPSQGEFALWVWARQNVKMTVGERTPARVVVTLSRPWLHPYLAERCPLSLVVPEGTQSVRWQGHEVGVTDGHVDLRWVAP